ncbi:hypothetical protein [Variovorax saccharolyticus]|uniref:hypothetical protein n=1 Tax=Variovorax saccharolyticus TaxID=3053516 RepID=UPI0025790E84|nr:hypothetical protein [Variovorax sp. J22R187]MDM0021086.1 hypothetical protein [Variovorax sp. J22R187]
MGFFGRLFGNREMQAPRDEEVERMMARVLDLSPRLQMAQGHEARLRGAIAQAATHLRELVAGFAPARDLSPAGWASDSHVRAFFGAADDVSPALGRSTELFGLFDRQPGLSEAYAVLGMAMNERRTLGVAQEGGVLRSDVAQTTLSFSDHQIRICGATEAELRQEIQRRMVDQLAIEALAGIADETARRDDLEQERALVAARLRLLGRQGIGMQSVLGGELEVDAGELARLRAQREENDVALRSLGSRSEALDRQLERMCQVLADAGNLIRVARRSLRLSRMNVVLEGQGAEDGHTLDLEVARVPGDPPSERAFALVKVARVAVPKPRNLLDEAARLL